MAAREGCIVVGAEDLARALEVLGIRVSIPKGDSEIKRRVCSKEGRVNEA